ncbi:MAG: PKD domain-containing protein [Tepidisphaeraceae bacterium]
MRRKPLAFALTKFYLLASLFLLPLPARADWFDSHWQFRRPLQLVSDADHTGSDLAMAEFYTAGHAAPDGRDVRVSLPDGRLVASHVLMAGPGDRVRIVFAITPGQNLYEVYFGNPDPAAVSAAAQDVSYQSGLLLDMRHWIGRPFSDAGQLASSWDLSGPPIGQTMVAQPFYGYDPLGDQSRVITKLTGSLVAPVDGEYLFTGSVTGRGAVFIDGKSVLYIPGPAHDIRYASKITLQRGPHNIVIYFGISGNQYLLSLAWRRPDIDKVEPIPASAFGVVSHAIPQAMEERDKTLVADFKAEYQGECFVGDNYSHRLQFTAFPPSVAADAVAHYDWDFGDGVTAQGPAVEHVYMTGGNYPVRLTVHMGTNTDTQTSRIVVDRDWPNIMQATEDPILRQARVIAQYDPARVPEQWLPLMAEMEQDAQLGPARLAAATQIARVSRHASAVASLDCLRQTTQALILAGQPEAAVKLLDQVPVDSDLQEKAASDEADLLIWWLADFPRALAVTERRPVATDRTLRLAHAEALILCGKSEDGTKLLDQLQGEQVDNGIKAAAVSGAMARTIEFRINDHDWQTGEQEWQTWQERFPGVFAEGYSVLLRIKLMQLRHSPAAAKVAEAFADGIRNSSYSPQLLDLAAKLTAAPDPAHSQQLRQELKDRYPEDPLSQEAGTPTP